VRQPQDVVGLQKHIVAGAFHADAFLGDDVGIRVPRLGRLMNGLPDAAEAAVILQLGPDAKPRRERAQCIVGCIISQMVRHDSICIRLIHMVVSLRRTGIYVTAPPSLKLLAT